MKRFILSCLRLVGAAIMIQILTQPYVSGRPSPPAFYDIATSTILPDKLEPCSTGVIAGLTPEESFEIVERILQGDLQPVIKTADMSFEPPNLSEVPTTVDWQSSDFMDVPELIDESVPYVEPPYLSGEHNVFENGVPKQELLSVESLQQSDPSFYQPKSGEVLESPNSYALTKESLEKGNEPVAHVTFESQAKNNDNLITSQDFPLDNNKNLSEVEETGFVDDNFVQADSVLSADNLVEDKSRRSGSSTLQPKYNVNFIVPHNTVIQNTQGFPETVEEGVVFKSVYPESTVGQVLTPKSSGESFLHLYHSTSPLASREVQEKSPQEIQQLSKSFSEDLSGQSIQDVQVPPESLDTDIVGYPLNYPDSTFMTVLSGKSLHFTKNNKDYLVGRDSLEEPKMSVPVSGETDLSKDMSTYPKHVKATDDVVLVRQLSDLKPDHPSGGVKDISEHHGAVVQNDTNISSGSAVSAIRKGIPVLAASRKDLTEGPVDAPRTDNGVSSDIPMLMTHSTPDSYGAREISYPGFKKYHSLLDPKKSLDMVLKSNNNIGNTFLSKRFEAPSKNGFKVVDNVNADPVIVVPGLQPFTSSGITGVGPGKLAEVEKANHLKKGFGDFRTVDRDLLALSDVLDSRQDSRSGELLWSTEDSEEDDEFWKKMKRFIEFENTHPSEPYEIQTENASPSVSSAGNINAIPSPETKPSETPVIHVMKIPKSSTDYTATEREEYYRDMESERSFERIPLSIPMDRIFTTQEEPPTTFPDYGELATTEATTPETGFTLNDEFEGMDEDVGEYSNNFATTEGSFKYTIPLTEWPEYSEKSTPSESDSPAKIDGDGLTGKENASIFEVVANAENEVERYTNSVKNQTFPKEQPKRTPSDDILPNRWRILPGNVGGLDYVPKLISDTILPQDEQQLSEGITENFTTDEPLEAEDDTFLEYPLKLPDPLFKEEKEALSGPTDLNLIEADSPLPILSNPNHFVSKKDDPMNTVKHVLNDDLQNKQKAEKTLSEIIPKASNKMVYPSPFKAIFKKRVRRNYEQTKDRIEEPSLNDVKSSAKLEPLASSPQSASSVVVRPLQSTSTSLNQVLLTPPPISIGETSKNMISTSVIQPPTTSPVTPDPLASSENVSIESTSLTLSATTVIPDLIITQLKTTPSTKLTTSISSHSMTLHPPAAYEMLPTPIPNMSTTVNPLASTLAPSNSTAPKKKKKKMVWKIPFYPDNIAITSTGEVRLEPKDKSVKVRTTTTSKPLLLNSRLKPEDIQAARERLFRRFQTRKPSTVPVSDAARADPSTYKTSQPMVPASNSTNRNSIGVVLLHPKVNDDLIAYVTAENPSQLPSLLYNSPEEREEARKRRLRSMMGLAGDVRSFLSDRARGAVRTVGHIVGGEPHIKDSQ